MADNNNPQKQKEKQQKTIQTRQERKTPIYIRQDKRGLVPARVASDQPARIADELRADAVGGFSSQSQNISSERKALEQLTLWVKPIVKEWTLRRAAEEGLSVSSFASALYEQAAQGSIDLQYSPQLKPVIEKTIRQEIRRAVKLLINTSQDVQMAKQLTSYTLEHMPGMTREKLQGMLRLAAARTKEEMTYRLKNLQSDMAAGEPEMNDGEDGHDENTN
jgi:hypothetical protein